MPTIKRPLGQRGRGLIDHHTQPIITGDPYSSPPPALLQLIEPPDCPRFNRCGANVCPLDDDWSLRTHLKGECVCFYLTEAVKPGGAARLRGITPRELAEKVLAALPRIIARYGPIRRALARSAKTGPRLGRRVGQRKVEERAA